MSLQKRPRNQRTRWPWRSSTATLAATSICRRLRPFRDNHLSWPQYTVAPAIALPRHMQHVALGDRLTRRRADGFVQAWVELGSFSLNHFDSICRQKTAQVALHQ